MSPIFSEFLVLVLCLFFTPESQKEVRIDVIDPSGYVDSLIVKPSKEGFSVYDEMNGELKQYMEIRRVKGKEHVYDCKNIRDRKETIDLSQAIVAFGSVDRHDERITLNMKAGGKVRVLRSGSVLYVTPPGKRTYVVSPQPEQGNRRKTTEEALQTLSGTILVGGAKSEFPYLLDLDGMTGTMKATGGILKRFEPGDRLLVKGVIRTRLYNRKPGGGPYQQPVHWNIFMEVREAERVKSPFGLRE